MTTDEQIEWLRLARLEIGETGVDPQGVPVAPRWYWIEVQEMERERDRIMRRYDVGFILIFVALILFILARSAQIVSH